MKVAEVARCRAARLVVTGTFPFVAAWVVTLRNPARVGRTLERFVRHIAGRSLESVSRQDLCDYKDVLIADALDRGIDPEVFATREMMVVKRLFKLAYESGAIACDPGAELVARAVYRGRRSSKQSTRDKAPCRSLLWNDPDFSERFDDALRNFRSR